MMQAEIDKVINLLREDVYKQLEDKLYESQIYNLGVYDVAEEVVTEYIKKILVDDKLRTRLTNSVSKAILEKHRNNEKKQKIQLAKNTKLWKASKGKIPCLRECGYHQEKSKYDVLDGEGINFICASCCKEMDDNNESFSKVFEAKRIYDIFKIV